MVAQFKLNDVLEQIRSEFANVLVEPRRGQSFIAAELESCAVQDREPLLKILPLALEVIAFDEPASDSRFLKLFLVPDRPVSVIFFSPEHRRDSSELLVRLSGILDEDVRILPEGTKLEPTRQTR